ncbi:S8 family serine peptidase [Pseudoclostridium thermosuccinogenes]|uniref:S8 family peptidase n=1 Tax=Clostridium thermosuccinogenes TaxID=84032 RepID=UPI002FD89490
MPTEVDNRGDLMEFDEFLNRDITIYQLINDEYKELLWGLRFVNAENCFREVDESRLSRIRVAVIDSGVEANHEDLKKHVARGWNFLDNTDNTEDDLGHGTGVAGIIGAERNNGVGIAGIASGAQLVPLKVIDSSGKAEIKNVIKAIEWCINNDIDIINLSLGHSLKDINLFDMYDIYLIEEEKFIIEKALEKSIVIIAAVGNELHEPMNFPARYKGVIPVASYGIKLNPLSIYSSDKNSIVNDETVFAPGEFIYTTLKGNSYGYERGSSFAAPFVTGVAALLKAYDENLTPHQIHQLILSTCKKIDLGHETIKIIDADKAFNKLRGDYKNNG